MKGWKTVTFNAVMTIVMVLSLWNPGEAENLPSKDEVQGLLDQADALLAGLWGVGNVILRAMTNTSIFRRE